MTVGELLGKIDSRELAAWAAYERVTGPLGPERADIQTAIIASTIANANQGKRGRRYRPEDFLPKWDQPAAAASGEQTGEDHLRLVKTLNRAMGGHDRTQGGSGVNSGGPPGQDRRGQLRRRQGQQGN